MPRGVYVRNKPFNRVLKYSGTCTICGAAFRSPWKQQKTCMAPECQVTHRKAQARDKQKGRYWRDPEHYRKVNRDRYATDPTPYREATDRWARIPCTRCGDIRYVNDRSRPRVGFLCGNCKRDERHAIAEKNSLPCRFCGKPAGIFQNTRLRATCADCHGLQARLSDELGLTRERARQLINRQRQKGLAYPDAVQAVRKERGLGYD